MADSNKELEILLKLKAETSEALSQINGAIDQIKSGGREIEGSMAGAGRGASAFGTLLGRTLTTGTVDAGALVSSLGMLGPVFAVVAGAALGAYTIITKVREAEERINQAIRDQNAEISISVGKWNDLAKAAGDFGDVANLGEKIKPGLEAMAAEMDKFRAQQLTWWKNWADNIAELVGAAWGGAGVRPYQDEAFAKADSQMVKFNIEAAKALTDAKEMSDVIEGIGKKPIAEQISIYSDKISEIKQKVAGVDLTNLGSLSGEDGRTRVRTAADLNTELSRYQGHLDSAVKEQDRLNKSTGGEKATRMEISATLRDQANLMAQIRDEQQIISSNPFLSADQKQSAMVPLITREITLLNEQIQRDKQLLHGSALDPAQYEQVSGKIQQAQTQVTLLGQKLKTLSFTGSIKADLIAWVNQFGTTAKQVAGIITSTLNTAIASTSQALTGLIFKTTSWKEAFASAAQAIVQNIIQILLQWIISRTIMSLLNKAFGKADTQAASGEASASAAAWAPAATSASIASYGTAAGLGVAAYLAALGVGTAGAITASTAGGAGSFAVGGYTGGREGRVAGVVHGEEYVFSAPAVRALGVSNLDAMHTSVSRPGYASGGYVGGSMPSAGGGGGGGRTPVHVYNFTDMKAMQKHILQSPAGQKIIVDTVNGRRVDIGMR